LAWDCLRKVGLELESVKRAQDQTTSPKD
jgi:hypothetical protein